MHIVATELGFALVFSDRKEKKVLIKNLSKMHKSSRVLFVHDNVIPSEAGNISARAIQKAGKQFYKALDDERTRACARSKGR